MRDTTRFVHHFSQAQLSDNCRNIRNMYEVLLRELLLAVELLKAFDFFQRLTEAEKVSIKTRHSDILVESGQWLGVGLRTL